MRKQSGGNYPAHTFTYQYCQRCGQHKLIARPCPNCHVARQGDFPTDGKPWVNNEHFELASQLAKGEGDFAPQGLYTLVVNKYKRECGLEVPPPVQLAGAVARRALAAYVRFNNVQRPHIWAWWYFPACETVGPAWWTFEGQGYLYLRAIIAGEIWLVDRENDMNLIEKELKYVLNG